MSMHSTTYLFVFLILAIVAIGALYAVVRTFGGKAVQSDHPADPYADRPADFGEADARRALTDESKARPEELG